MIRTVAILALVALASAAPKFSAPMFSNNLADFPHEHGCHYNISAATNFKLTTGKFQLYFDSITSHRPLNGVTCIKWNGSFKVQNGNVGKLDLQWKIVGPNGTETINCTGKNYADQPADFWTSCVFVGHNTGFNLEIRVSGTDEKTYVFETFCAGPFHGHFHEFMGFLTPTKAPLNAATRAALTKRLVDAGWNPKYIQRVPTQNGC